MELIHFVLIFALLNGISSYFFTNKLNIPGIDLVFLGSWLSGVFYGFTTGVPIGIALTLQHALLSISKSYYILLSIPSQILAVFLGSFLGTSGFFVSLVAYHLSNTFLGLIAKGIGGTFFIFVLMNSFYNFSFFWFLTALGII